MREEIIKRNLIIIAISLIIFFFVSLFITSYSNRRSLENDLIQLTDIVNQQILATNTEEDIQKMVNLYTNNQDWMQIVIANSLGTVLYHSATDYVNYQLPSHEMNLINQQNELIKKVYYDTDKHSIYMITKINDDIITRTSLPIKSNTNYILNSVFYMLILIIGVLVFSIIYNKKTSDMVIDTFSTISHHLKTINDNRYQKININHKYSEVRESLKVINEINENIANSMMKIKKESDKIAFIINNMQHGIMIIDQFETILIINDYSLKALNIKEKPQEGSKLRQTITNDIILNQIINSLEDKQIRSFDIHDDEKEKIYAYTLSYLESKWHTEKESIGILVVLIIDVTAERRNEELKAEFIANASHELKTPITSISGFSELILNDFGDCDDLTKQYIKKIYLEANRMRSIIDELLFLSNLDYQSNQTNLTEIVHLESLINDAVTTYQDMALRQNIKIIVKAKKVNIIGSVSLIRHLIYNLLENAIKYNKENGCVTLTITEETKHINLTISDTGIGIEEKHLNKIFERFFCVSGSRNRLTGGTGLGLTIANKICQVHNATIKVSSIVGEGTTVTVSFKK